MHVPAPTDCGLPNEQRTTKQLTFYLEAIVTHLR